MKRTINIILCVVLGFLSYHFIFSVYGHEITKIYGELTRDNHLPSYEYLENENQRLKSELASIRTEKAKMLQKHITQTTESNSQKFKVDYYKRQNESYFSRVSQLESLERVNYEKENERRRLVTDLVRSDDKYRRIYFLMGWGCLFGKELFSARTAKHLPKWGYCYYPNQIRLTGYSNGIPAKPYRNLVMPKLYYYDSLSEKELDFGYRDLRYFDVQEKNEYPVFDVHIEESNYKVKIKLSEFGNFEEVYRLNLSGMIDHVKSLNIKLKDQLDRPQEYSISIEDYVKTYFVKANYQQSWSKSICKDDSNKVCVKLSLSYDAGSGDFIYNKRIRIVFMFHYADLTKVIDKSIDYKRNFGDNKTHERPSSFEELLQIDKESNGWLVPK